MESRKQRERSSLGKRKAPSSHTQKKQKQERKIGMAVAKVAENGRKLRILSDDFYFLWEVGRKIISWVCVKGNVAELDTWRECRRFETGSVKNQRKGWVGKPKEFQAALRARLLTIPHLYLCPAFVPTFTIGLFSTAASNSLGVDSELSRSEAQVISSWYVRKLDKGCENVVIGHAT